MMKIILRTLKEQEFIKIQDQNLGSNKSEESSNYNWSGVFMWNIFVVVVVCILIAIMRRSFVNSNRISVMFISLAFYHNVSDYYSTASSKEPWNK